MRCAGLFVYPVLLFVLLFMSSLAICAAIVIPDLFEFDEIYGTDAPHPNP